MGIAGGVSYIVCELLEGKTLRKHLSEGALAISVAVDYSLQIVQGLIAAHDRGITHRDLKPENLFVTTDGRLKILDFGVAKLQPVPGEAERSVEDLTTVTRGGAIIGTVAYMAPEQLRGKAVDRRSDLFSLGAILYEMLTGQRAFRGESEVDAISAVLLEDPPAASLERANVPISLQQIVRHCLEKDPENRFQTARDLAFALDTLPEASGNRQKLIEVPRPRARIFPWAVAGVLLTATLVLTATLLLMRKQGRGNAQSPTYRRLTFDEGTVSSARFTPDFRAIVYSAAWDGGPAQLFFTVTDSLATEPLPVKNAELLAISRSSELAVMLSGDYRVDGKTVGMLARAQLAGGPAREILENVRSADWDAKGELAVVHRIQGRDRIEYPIGRVLYWSAGRIGHIRLSPRGDKIAFIDYPGLSESYRRSVSLVDLSGHLTLLVPDWESGDSGLAWGPDGKEVWLTASEPGTGRHLIAIDMSGRTRKILELSENTTLEDVAPDGRVLVSLDREHLGMVTTARDSKTVEPTCHGDYIPTDISRDGQMILLEGWDRGTQRPFVAICKIDGALPVRLGEGGQGRFSPDDKSAIAIPSYRARKPSLLPIGAGQPHTIDVTGLENIYWSPPNFLADGKRFTIDAKEPGHDERTYLVSLEGGKPIPITPEGFPAGLISPDGRFVLRDMGAPGAFSNVFAVYPVGGGVPRPIPNLDPGFEPIRWSEDNSSVYGYFPGHVPVEVYKVNLATGSKILLQKLNPGKAGVVDIEPVVNHDGSRFAYSYEQVSSVLYIISGLH